MSDNNPFEMWGSWLGAIISLIYFYFSTKFGWFDIRDIFIRCYSGGLHPQTGSFITATWVSILLGFLIGWGIHSLVRRYIE